jgi:hypothetical protein
MQMIGGSVTVLFVRVMHLWLAGFLLSCYPVFGKLWIDPVSPALSFPAGPISLLVDLSDSMPSGFWMLLPLIGVVIALLSAFGRVNVWFSIVIWAIYVVLVSRGWMGSTGGQQLMAIMLLWSVPLSMRSHQRPLIVQAAAWAARMQLVLIYLSTFLHKLQGTDWLTGKAVGILASDPTFNLGWIQGFPAVAEILTYLGLVFQLGFAVGVWIPRMRIWVLLTGVLFHLFTAVAIEIPDMAFAFILSYTIWLSESELDKCRSIIDGELRAYIPSLRR